MAFPSNPANGQTFTSGGFTYIFNSRLRTWSKTAQASTTVGNVIIANGNIDGNVITGNTSLTSTGVNVGNVSLSNTGVNVGNVTLSNTGVNVGNVTVSNTGVNVGNVTLSNTGVNVGNVTVSNTGVNVGNVILSNNSVNVGNVTINDTGVNVGNVILSNNSVNVGNVTVSNTGVNVGNVAISNTGVNVGNVTLTTNSVNVGNVAISNTGVNVGNVTISNISVNVGNVSLSENSVVIGNSNVSGNTISTGNVTANYFIGNGYYLTGLNGDNVVGPVANANFAGYVTQPDQTNITSVGTLIGLAVSGETVITGNLVVSGNVTYLNVQSVEIEDPIIAIGGGTNSAALTSNDGKDRGTLLHYYTTDTVDAFMGWDNSNAEFAFGSNVSVTNDVVTFNSLGNVRASYFIGNGSQLTGVSANTATSANTAGTVTANSQPNISSVGTLITLDVSGNITAGNFIGPLSNGTSNINIPISNGNINLSVSGNSNILVVTGTGVNVSGTLDVIGNLSVINATLGNIATANFFIGDGSNLNSLNGANVFGTVESANNAVQANNANTANTANTANVANTANTANTVINSVQANITSVGILTGLSVSNASGSANFEVANLTLGNVSNLHILGGSANYVLKTDGAGNLSWTEQTGGGGGTGTGIANGTSNVNIPVANGNIAVSVNGSANVVIVSDTGVNVSGTLNTTGNANFGNIGAASGVFTTVEGTLTTALQPNITSVGTLSNLTVTGNVSAGNIGANNAVFTGTGSFGGNINVNGFAVTGLGIPNNFNDAATKQYVDDVAQGLHTHDACQVATPDTLANITGGTITYNNGSSGVGANLVTTGSFNLIDGVNVQTAGTRILVKNQTNLAHNGIYVWSNATVITRATDFDAIAEMAGGDFTFVQDGTLYSKTGWVMVDTVLTVGTDPVEWTQFSGAGTYNAGTGLTLTGPTFSVNPNQIQITSVGTLTGLTSNGIINFTNTSNVSLGSVSNLKITGGSANFVLRTDGAGNLTWVAQSGGTGTSIANGTSNVTIPVANGNVNISANGNANVVSINGLGVNISGILNTTGIISAPDADLGNAVTANFFLGNGSLLTGIVASNATAAGTVTSSSQPNITSVGTLVSLDVTGNVTANNFVGRLANGQSNIDIPASSGNIIMGVGGNANVITIHSQGASIGAGFGGNITGANWLSANFITGAITTNAQPNITSVGTLANLTVTGNISSGNLSATRLAGSLTTNAQPNITSVGTLTSLSVSGGFSLSGNFSAGNVFANSGNLVSNVLVSNFVAGALTTAAQPNITSIGTLTGLTSNGVINFTNASNVSLGNVANVKITGGTTSQFLRTDGAGNLTWASVVTGNGFAIANGTSNINISVANGNISMSVNGNANILQVISTGIVVNGTANITNDVTLSGSNVTIPSANVTMGGGIISLGNVGNVKITGGFANQFLKTDGTGNLTWAAGGGGGGGGAIPINDDTSNNVTYYPVYAVTSSGDMEIAGISSTKLQFNPSSGQLTVTDLNTLSDQTLKENVQPIDDPMAILNKIFGVGFNWVENGRKSYGVLAQVLEQILPELVNETAQGTKTVNYLPIMAFLIEAVKMQHKDIEALKKKINKSSRVQRSEDGNKSKQ